MYHKAVDRHKVYACSLYFRLHSSLHWPSRCRYKYSDLLTTQNTNMVTCSICLTVVPRLFVCLWALQSAFWPKISSLLVEKVSRFFYKLKTINGNLGKKLMIQLSMTQIFLDIPLAIFTPGLGIAGLAFSQRLKKSFLLRWLCSSQITALQDATGYMNSRSMSQCGVTLWPNKGERFNESLSLLCFYCPDLNAS